MVANEVRRSPVKARTYSIAIYAVNAHAEGLLGGAVLGARVTAMLTRATSSEGLRRLTMAIWAGFAYDADLTFF